MSDIMRSLSFHQLMDWVLTEYQARGSIFGVSKVVKHENGQALPIFQEKIESPFGPAAGPHTQLAQNIIAAYAAGSRFFELKTVQIMDGEELAKCVAKPCITAGDECYNCEWSTELYVPQACAEYVKAWFACKLIAREFGLGDPDGFVFNMSVGYDLAGIKSEKIDAYIEGMKNAAGSQVWQECMDWALANVSRFQTVDADYVKAISPKVSDSITESTLHGCPPDEIERIATYLITEKGLNTYVKCNPTLLGYDFARKTLDELGFDYIAFDDHHFKEDLQREDAFPMFRRLTALTKARGLEFGVKLTNTFPVDVAAGELPSGEMYMSGRSLYPLTMALAAIISKEFEGKLRISYSGGADASNIKDLFDAGIWPITMATTMLKPGGYQRLSQIGALLMDCGSEPFHGVDAAKVERLARAARTGSYCRKPIKALPDRKIGQKVPLIDCFNAPCRSGCPIEQDIPAYLMAYSQGKYDEALEIITRRNPLPFITGTICPHHCGDKCMRNYYDETVRIRDVKLACAQKGNVKIAAAPAVAGKKVAIVGGGPAGLAAAFFLGRSGVSATIFEASGNLGGVVRNIIPAFRIAAASIDADVALCTSLGVEVRLNTPVSGASELVAQGFTDIIFATGAQKAGDPRLKYGGYVNFTEVLAAIKNGATPDLGADVAVIGGGNSAMDTARAVKRLPGVEHVRLIYRRTKKQMPAEEEELQLALDEGVEFLELLAPVGVKDGVLTCSVMELGAPDASGRRSPMDTGKTVALPCSTLVAAVGEHIDESVDVGAWPVIGDRKRGPATVVEAIADATAAVRAITGMEVDAFVEKNVCANYDKPLGKHGDLCADCDSCTDTRCLGCATVCETCAEVCPNRANITVAVPGMRQRQIVHVDGMCNECGNCATFCPYNSRPYRDKLTLYWSREDFDNSENEGWLPKGDGSGVCLVRLDGQVSECDVTDNRCGLPEAIRQVIVAVRDNYGYLVKEH